MEVITKTITLEDVTEPLVIIPLGDVHLGNASVDIVKLKGTIDYIRNKTNCYAVLMGDLADAIMTNDKRFDPESVAPEFRKDIGNLAFAEYEMLKDLLMPIREKILVGIRGNHDETLRLKYNVDFSGWLHKELKVPLVSNTAFLVIKFDREQFHTQTLTFFLNHGWSATRKTGGNVNSIEDLAGSFEADVYLLGHSHKLFVTSKIKLSVAGEHIKEKKQFFANTGTFLKTYAEGCSNYGEKGGYTPLKTGVIKFSIYPKSTGIDIHASE